MEEAEAYFAYERFIATVNPGTLVEALHPEKAVFVEAVVVKIDSSGVDFAGGGLPQRG